MSNCNERIQTTGRVPEDQVEVSVRGFFKEKLTELWYIFLERNSTEHMAHERMEKGLEVMPARSPELQRILDMASAGGLRRTASQCNVTSCVNRLVVSPGLRPPGRQPLASMKSTIDLEFERLQNDKNKVRLPLRPIQCFPD